MATKLDPRHVHVDTAELKEAYPDFYRDVQDTKLWPLWEEMNRFANRTEPGPGMVPAIWRYSDVRPHPAPQHAEATRADYEAIASSGVSPIR